MKKLGLAVTGALSLWMSTVPSVSYGLNVTSNTTLFGTTNSQVSWTGGNFSITNTGVITGSASPALNVTGSVGTLTNNGLISTSGGHGMDNSGNIPVLVNNGTITASAGAGTGISNNGSIGTLSNSGLINGGVTTFGAITTLINSGLISATSVSLGIYNSGSVGSLINSGTIVGNIANTTATNLSISGGSGSTFGTLTGYNGTIGLIDNQSSNVVFSSGNLLLNDNINVASHTVSNLASTLQLNNRITITGNYFQGAGATLIMGVANGATSNGVTGDTGYGSLVVTGNTTIASGSTITLKKLNSYAFAQGQRFVAISTTGTATYNAGALTYTSPANGLVVTGATVVDGNGKNNLVLTLASNAVSGEGNSSAPINRASTTNGTAALNGLFRYTGINNDLLNVFNAAAALGSSDSANRAGAQLSPASNAGAAVNSSTASTTEVLNMAAGRVDGLRVAQAGGQSGIATGERGSDIALWGQAFGGKSNQAQRDNISGYYANYKGLLIGADTQTGDRWRVGGLVSYANTSLANTGDNTGSSASADSYGVTGYAGYTADRYFLDFSAGVVSHSYHTVRNVNFSGFSGSALGKFNGLQYVASVRGGYPIKLDDWLSDTTLTPLLGLSYSNLRQNGYSETGGNGAALSVGAASNSSLKSELGAKLERRFATSYGEMIPSLQLGWRHEYRSNAQQLTASYVNDGNGATSFVSQGASPIRDTGVLALGLTLMRSERVSIAARYTLEGASGFTSQTADVRLRYQF